MANTEQITKIIDIQFSYDELIKGIQATKEQINYLNSEVSRWKNELKSLSKDEEKYLAILRDETSTNKERAVARERLNKIITRQEEVSNLLADAEREQLVQSKALKDAQNQYTKELQNNIKIQLEAEGSLAKMRAQLSNLRAEYEHASEAGRQKLLPQINDLKDKINAADNSIQEYNANVGNYENAILRALGINNKFGQSLLNNMKSADGFTNMIKAAGQSVKVLVVQSLAFIATPLGVVLAALAAAFVVLRNRINQANEAIKGSEQLSAEYQR